MKKKSTVYIRIFLVLAFLIIVGGLGYRYYSRVKVVAYKYNTEKDIKPRKIISFANNRYLLVDWDNEEAGGYSVGSQYFISYSRKLINYDAEAYDTKYYKDEYYKIHVYNLNSPTRIEKTFDLFKVLRKNKGTYKVRYPVDLFTLDNVDYIDAAGIYINLDTLTINRDKKFIQKVKKMQDETRRVGQTIDEIQFLDDSSIADDFLDKYTLSEGLKVKDKMLHFEGTNFEEEYPKIAKSYGKNTKIIRTSLVSNQEHFNNVLHWFAPQGQDVMELYVTDPNTGEKTQIKSYQDYETWRQIHLQE